MDNQFDLDRFVQAQDPVYAAVLTELRAGHKRTHWMWFVFPQIAGLGTPALYAGSWSEWSNTPGLPTRQGPEP